jgi:type IV pilus assembly protein PilE
VYLDAGYRGLWLEMSDRSLHQQKGHWMATQNQAERVFTQTNSYATAVLPVTTDFYTYTFSTAASATGYTIQAAPKTVQDQDGCGTMTLDEAGIRTQTGSMADCW